MTEILINILLIIATFNVIYLLAMMIVPMRVDSDTEEYIKHLEMENRIYSKLVNELRKELEKYEN